MKQQPILDPNFPLRLCASAFYTLILLNAKAQSIWPFARVATHLPLRPYFTSNSLCNKKLEFARIIPAPCFFGRTSNPSSGTAEFKPPQHREQRRSDRMPSKCSHSSFSLDSFRCETETSHSGLDCMQCRAGRESRQAGGPASGSIAGGEHSPETEVNESSRNIIHQTREDAAWGGHEPEFHQSAANSAFAELSRSCQRPDG